MKLLSLFRRPEAPNPARDLSRMGHAQRREFIRWRTNQMRADMGMAPVKWGRL